VDRASLGEHFADAGRSHRERKAGHDLPVEQLHRAEANTPPPVDGYVSLVCDILGFSMEAPIAKRACRPDLYGAAAVAAADTPDVKVDALSDSCRACAPPAKAVCCLRAVAPVAEHMRADGLPPGVSSGMAASWSACLPPASLLATSAVAR
jgi:hypothetical protein